MEYILKDNLTGKPSPIWTKFSIIRDNHHIRCSFEAHDSSLNSFSNTDNDELYKGDVVELFLDIGEKDAYLEIEVAPNGAKFVANIINRKINLLNPDIIKSTSVIKENNYFVDIDIDLSKFKVIEPIRFNAYRIETKGIKRDYILLAVNPTLTDSFHVRDRFILM